MRESRNILTLILDSEITRYVQNLLLERSHSVLTKYFINNFYSRRFSYYFTISFFFLLFFSFFLIIKYV